MHEHNDDSNERDENALALSRRDWLAETAQLGLGAAIVHGCNSLQAQEIESNPFLRLIPKVKQLDAAWVRSLFERGEKQIYRSEAAMKHIGMPVGGLFAGTVYLGGDGRLWLWDIFNAEPRGISPRPFVYQGSRHQANTGLNFVFPAEPSSPFVQQFGIRASGKVITLDRDGFQDVSFRGEYPRGIVSYRDAELPISARLEAFSPFIPMNADDSSLPATVMSYTVKNEGTEALELEVFGSLQNAICQSSKSPEAVQLWNQVVRGDGYLGVECSASPGKAVANQSFCEQMRDYGTMTIALLGDGEHQKASAVQGTDKQQAKGESSSDLVGEVARVIRLAGGAETVVTFAVSWFFPNYRNKYFDNDLLGHYYTTRFDSSTDVTRYLATDGERLFGQTREWVETWYDSSLPYWFLDRTMANTSTLATTTCYRFRSGRFWAWESPGHLQGTCAHVWHYAQSLARLFPELERHTRDQIDFGIGQNSDGSISFRTNKGPMSTRIVDGRPAIADDGHLGRILCVFREHQMTEDLTFLKGIWPRVKRAMDWAIAKDQNGDGIIEGAQRHTLVATWFGKVAWLASLYLAALRATETMATEVGDTAYAFRCKTIADVGSRKIGELFDGEYFIQDKGVGNEKTTGAGTGCFIDQMAGQTWAHWLGLGHLFERQQQVTALRSLYRYNFITDYGPFRKHFGKGRFYGLAGDAGLLMCTWPKSDPDPLLYFYEFMTGFEWQASSHMIFEGSDHPDLLQHGLAVARAIHDRYSAEHRNPYNEIEDGDHYVRAMASFGAYQAACGYEHHGPHGQISFAPRINAENFKAAFTAANSWGSYSQHQTADSMQAELSVKWGNLQLQQVKLHWQRDAPPTRLNVDHDGRMVKADFHRSGQHVYIGLIAKTTICDGESIRFRLT